MRESLADDVVEIVGVVDVVDVVARNFRHAEANGDVVLISD
jgi:hypothetical protein